jgi:hypothetical protein
MIYRRQLEADLIAFRMYNSRISANSQSISYAKWYVKSETENALVAFFAAIISVGEEEMDRHHQKSYGKSIVDPVLATLLQVKHRAKRGRSA